eukprot:TRINITY_DN2673_c0_g1_i10.p1 TRINITY_DN2673_c0_g1~~TRINITY_DN2673_c0_g1_i10.p1  ORF type:complete len:703 (-),score=125.75 TRINITY_DN2673_c0_g1_i10:67-2175(-)
MSLLQNFRSDYQNGPSFEIFSAQGSNPLHGWKVIHTGSANSVHKEFDKPTKSSVLVIEGSSQTRLQLPADDKKGLGLIQPYLVFQIFVSSGQSFGLELSITDQDRNKRRLILSSSVKDVTCTALHSRLPLTILIRNEWHNLVIDLPNLVSHCWRGHTFRTLESISLSPYCRLRRIFTMKSCPIETMTPGDDYVQLPPGVSFDTIPRAMDFPPGILSQTFIYTMERVFKVQGKPSDTGSELSAKDSQSASTPRTQTSKASSNGTRQTRPLRADSASRIRPPGNPIPNQGPSSATRPTIRSDSRQSKQQGGTESLRSSQNSQSGVLATRNQPSGSVRSSIMTSTPSPQPRVRPNQTPDAKSDRASYSVSHVTPDQISNRSPKKDDDLSLAPQSSRNSSTRQSYDSHVEMKADIFANETGEKSSFHSSAQIERQQQFITTPEKYDASKYTPIPILDNCESPSLYHSDQGSETDDLSASIFDPTESTKITTLQSESNTHTFFAKDPYACDVNDFAESRHPQLSRRSQDSAGHQSWTSRPVQIDMDHLRLGEDFESQDNVLEGSFSDSNDDHFEVVAASPVRGIERSHAKWSGQHQQQQQQHQQLHYNSGYYGENDDVLVESLDFQPDENTDSDDDLALSQTNLGPMTSGFMPRDSGRDSMRISTPDFVGVGHSQQRSAPTKGIELLYDPLLDCYYDPKSNQYYQIN